LWYLGSIKQVFVETTHTLSRYTQKVPRFSVHLSFLRPGMQKVLQKFDHEPRILTRKNPWENPWEHMAFMG
jgi:hypothetical protein